MSAELYFRKELLRFPLRGLGFSPPDLLLTRRVTALWGAWGRHMGPGERRAVSTHGVYEALGTQQGAPGRRLVDLQLTNWFTVGGTAVCQEPGL